MKEQKEQNNIFDDFDVDFNDLDEEELDFGIDEPSTLKDKQEKLEKEYTQEENIDNTSGDNINSESEDFEQEEDNQEEQDDFEKIETNQEVNQEEPDEPDDSNESEEKSETQEQTSEDITKQSAKKDLVLYILTDKALPGMLSYFRGYGVQVSKIFSNINEARDTLLMQVEPSRIIIIDTGSGRFTNMASRNALIDLIGICDEDAKISIFYTDSIIKSEIEDSDDIEEKMIQWHKYRSTADILANILQKSKDENYIYDMQDKDEDISKNALNITGLKVTCPKQIDLGAPAIRVDEIIINMVENLDAEDTIPGYKIKV